MSAADPVREALQAAINADGVREDCVVAHYVAIVGLFGATEDGGSETSVVVFEQNGQAGYITHGLLCEAPDILARCADEADCDEND